MNNTIITKELIEQYRDQHNREVECEKCRLNSVDNIERAYARSVVYGHHDPLLYAIRDREFFNKEYSGIEYVLSVFEKYGYDTKQYYQDNILCIDVLKNGEVYTQLTFSELYNRISMFSIK